MKVAIVGFGPAAMYAIIACNDRGIYPTVMANAVNINPGAFWLKSVPKKFVDGTQQHRIVITKVGERENYIRKQWNEFPVGYKSSFPDTEFVEYGYDPVVTVPWILSQLKFDIEDTGKLGDPDLIKLGKKYDFVFHSFPSELARKTLGNMIVKVPVTISTYDIKQGNRVIYNGRKGDFVVRVSYLFGKKYTEYSVHNMDSKDLDSKTNRFSQSSNVRWIEDLRPISLSISVPYLAYNIIPIGRLGGFDRTVLAHHTYDLVSEIIEEI